MRTIPKIAAALTAMTLATCPLLAAEIEVEMLNRGAEGVMVFEPSLIKLAPGDTVKFMPTDRGHNVETIKGMLPEGAESFAGKLNEEVTITFDKPGVYGVRCKPHYGMGMVGLIVVGEPANTDNAKAVTHPGRAKQIFAKLFDRLATEQTAMKQP
ncbi:pseudoazurin [Taklimakanibacter lacteus]|uniref:pseudoazurin n=1 Tax=Taklimakanibacter lacteus TaxID=2268456 RepID=UPI000E664ECD